MTQVIQPESAVEVVVPAKAGTRKPLVILPFVGETTIEDVTFYGVLGAVTLAELVSWPTAALIGSAHALHQRAHNLRERGIRRGEFMEGALEATEEMI